MDKYLFKTIQILKLSQYVNSISILIENNQKKTCDINYRIEIPILLQTTRIFIKNKYKCIEKKINAILLCSFNLTIMLTKKKIAANSY